MAHGHQRRNRFTVVVWDAGGTRLLWETPLGAQPTLKTLADQLERIARQIRTLEDGPPGSKFLPVGG